MELKGDRYMNNKTQMSINYNMVSLIQFILSILVIALHCTRIFSNDILHFIQKSFFSRMAVPYFLIASSFFIQLKMVGNPNYLTKYMKKTLKGYLLWSALFLPYGFYFFKSTNIPVKYILVALLFAIMYLGVCYHLWYIPALLFGIFFTNKLIKLCGYRISLLICSILYVLGSLETYSNVIDNTLIATFYNQYKTVFFTTRNGLLFTPIYILLGVVLFKRFNEIQKIKSVKFLFGATILFIFEARFIFFNQGDDKNFYLSLVPFTFSLFYWSITTPILKKETFLT